MTGFQLNIVSRSPRGEAMVFIDMLRARILVSSNIAMALTAQHTLLGKCPPVYIDPATLFLLNTHFKQTCFLPIGFGKRSYLQLPLKDTEIEKKQRPL